MHNLNYLLIMFVFPILLTGLLIFPATLFNKKSLFFIVPFAQIAVCIKCIQLALPWHSGSLLEMLGYFFKDQRILHIPIIFVPVLIFSIIIAYSGSNYVANFYNKIKKEKNVQIQILYRKLDHLNQFENKLSGSSDSLYFDLAHCAKKFGNYIFTSFDESTLNVVFENDYPDETIESVLASIGYKSGDYNEETDINIIDTDNNEINSDVTDKDQDNDENIDLDENANSENSQSNEEFSEDYDNVDAAS